jgi:serine/threonine-protein kinase
MGQTISHYRLEQELGRGGMGRVYKAYDTVLDRTVVLKLLASDLITDKESRNRFLREARLASALDHPNICTIYEIAEADGQYFIAMQYVPGKTLKQLIGGRPLSLDSLLSIALQVGDAIAAAHARGIIHRDIKSTNIIITPRGQVKVLDFGLAKLLADKERAVSPSTGEAEVTRVGATLGTPSYMSPEQARGERVDHRSDIFSFGVVLYEMAAGRTPFKEKSQVETMSAVINQPHPPVIERNKNIPPPLSALIDRALAKKPSDRYQSVQQMVEELRPIRLSLRLVALSIPDGVMVPYVRPRRQPRLGAVGRWMERFWKSEATWETPPSQESVADQREPYQEQEFSLTRGSARTLAVLPFRNLSGDPSADFYGLSLADSLITELAKWKSLIVRPSSLVAKYQNLSIDPAQVRRELDVEIMLTGNFLKAGDRVRVTAQLINVTSSELLWSERIDTEAQDVLKIQDRISQRIVSGLASGQVTADPIELLKDESEEVRLDAVRTLKFSHDPRALSALIEAMRDPSLKVKTEAVQALVRLGEPATGPVIELLHSAMDEGDHLTARFAAKALGLIGDRSISSVLLELLGSDDTFVACEAALALGRLRESKAVPELIALLDHSSGNIRFAAAEALGQICDPTARDALQNRLKDDDEGVRAKARWALSRLKKASASVGQLLGT